MENIRPGTFVAPPRRWPLFLVGILLFLAGPVIYFVQINRQLLETPWYAPALASLGVLVMAVSVGQRGGRFRKVGLVVFVVVCGLEWYWLAVGTMNPVYHGPAQAGRALPPFTTTLADGKVFASEDLAKGGSSVLVFYRGHW